MKRFLLAGAAAAVVGLASTAQAALFLGAGLAAAPPLPAGDAVATAGIIPTPPGGTGNRDNQALLPTTGNQRTSGLGFVNPLGGFYGAQLYATAGTVTFEFLGFEAGGKNQFFVGGSLVYDTKAYGLTQTTPRDRFFNINGLTGSSALAIAHTGGLLDFEFKTDQKSGAAGRAVNGHNRNEVPAGSAEFANYFITFHAPAGSNTSGPTRGDVAYIFFDDTGFNRSPCTTSTGQFCNDDDNHDDMVIRATFTPFPVPEPASLALLGAGLLGLGIAARRRRRA